MPVTPSSVWSIRTRLGPSPGICVICTRPTGIFALSFSAAGIDPVSRSAATFSAIVFPTPARSSARPCRDISATDAPDSRMALAALR